ncbi:MAG: iron response transcriptional regulator IrrA [Hyphomicrobium sp.]|jgi:Fur family iron response transcriptional regulator
MSHHDNQVSQLKFGLSGNGVYGDHEAMTNSTQPASCEAGRDPMEIVSSLKCQLCTRSCQTRELGSKLRDAGLRPTRQRLQLAKLLYGAGDRHFTADMLHEDALRERIPVSLATVYNTLQQFTQSGLLRRLAMDGQKTWFDTNVSDHHHLFYEEDNAIVDVPNGYLSISQLPPVPAGMEIARIEVVVRLRRSEPDA